MAETIDARLPGFAQVEYPDWGSLFTRLARDAGAAGLRGPFVLDALGIVHDHGLIREDAAAPDPTKVGAVAAALARDYPAPDVALYLNTLLWQDPASWGGLQGLPEVSLG